MEKLPTCGQSLSCMNARSHRRRPAYMLDYLKSDIGFSFHFDPLKGHNVSDLAFA